MALLLRSGGVFLHVPKTGGSWVTRVLEDLGVVTRHFAHAHADVERALRHLSPMADFKRSAAEQVKARVPRELRVRLRRAVGVRSRQPTKPSRFVFCFVRDPVDWYVSWWRYARSIGWRTWGSPHGLSDWHPNAMLNALLDDDFDRFVRAVLRERPCYVTEMYGWYDRPDTSFVGRQEHLAEDLCRALGQMGIVHDPEQLGATRPINRTEGAGVRWDPGLRAEVERVEHAGRLRYGYVG